MTAALPGAEAGSTLFPVADLRSFLEGDWRLSRRLHDQRAGQRGSFDGAARFSGSGLALHYREDGEMRFGAFRGRAFRSYLYDFATPGRAELRFADGRSFHDLDLSKGWWEALHLCGRDRYRVEVRAFGRDLWETRWRIEGPRKDLRLTTRYSRGDGRRLVAEAEHDNNGRDERRSETAPG